MSRVGVQGGFGVGGVNPASQVPVSPAGSPFSEEIDLNSLSRRVILPCANLEWASVQTSIIDSSYGSAVLTVKGTLNGVNFVTLGEPTITADGIYGPLYIAGLVQVCLEVTTVAGSAKLCRVFWRGWGKLP